MNPHRSIRPSARSIDSLWSEVESHPDFVGGLLATREGVTDVICLYGPIEEREPETVTEQEQRAGEAAAARFFAALGGWFGGDGWGPLPTYAELGEAFATFRQGDIAWMEYIWRAVQDATGPGIADQPEGKDCAGGSATTS